MMVTCLIKLNLGQAETEINGKITKKASSFHFKLAVPLHYDWIFSEGAWPILLSLLTYGGVEV